MNRTIINWESKKRQNQIKKETDAIKRLIEKNGHASNSYVETRIKYELVYLTRDFRIISIKDMSDDHLCNTVKLLFNGFRNLVFSSILNDYLNNQLPPGKQADVVKALPKTKYWYYKQNPVHCLIEMSKHYKVVNTMISELISRNMLQNVLEQLKDTMPYDDMKRINKHLKIKQSTLTDYVILEKRKNKLSSNLNIGI